MSTPRTVADCIDYYRKGIKERTGMDLADFAPDFEDAVNDLRSWAEPWERVVCLVALEESLDERAAAE